VDFVITKKAGFSSGDYTAEAINAIERCKLYGEVASNDVSFVPKTGHQYYSQ
jgi:hypothetical protein